MEIENAAACTGVSGTERTAGVLVCAGRQVREATQPSCKLHRNGCSSEARTATILSCVATDRPVSIWLWAGQQQRPMVESTLTGSHTECLVLCLTTAFC